MEIFSGESARKNAIRAGFAAVLALGLFSMIEAAFIQERVSTSIGDLYRQHIEQDEIRFELRRMLWLAVSAARDFLLDPSEERERELDRQVDPLRGRSNQLLDRLEESPQSSELRRRFDEFWKIVDAIPAATAAFDQRKRYEYVQRELAPRRSVLAGLLREWDGTNQEALSASRLRMDSIGRFGAARLFAMQGLSLLGAVVVTLLCVRYSERLENRAREHHRQVERNKDELARLSSRLMEVQERERARLSRELHDEIGQSLATVRLEVARAAALPAQRIAEIHERLNRARALMDSTVETVRSTCMLLRPSLLDDLGLIPAIQWLAEDFERRTGVACAFSSEGVDDELSEPVRTCVYRVVQESLHNAEKHAAADRVVITVLQSRGVLTAVVEDDGKGFETQNSQAAMRFGLLGMGERATAAGGDLEIISGKGHGTRVELRVPVAAGREAAKAVAAGA